MARRLALFFGLIIACSGIFFSAQASQSVPFTDIPLLTQQRMKAYFKNKTPDSIDAVDLNGDGMDEYVVRVEECAKEQCTFTVLADTEKELIELGQIKARTTRADTARTNGILNIRAYDNENNDYSYTVFVWSPEEKTYVAKK